MGNIINVNEAISLSKKFRTAGKTVVLAGGCFDVLHLGHVKFLEAAKKTGDSLFVLLESNENVRKYKGVNRPIHSQNERAQVLSAIKFVDYVIILPLLDTNQEYDKIVERINPSVIAVTKDSKTLEHGLRQAGKIGAKLIPVIDIVPDKSTSKIAQIIAEENKL